MNPLDDDKFIEAIRSMRENDAAGFAETVLAALKKHEQFALEDEAPVENKLLALQKLVDYFELDERYEDCAFLVELKKKIADGSKA